MIPQCCMCICLSQIILPGDMSWVAQTFFDNAPSIVRPRCGAAAKLGGRHVQNRCLASRTCGVELPGS